MKKILPKLSLIAQYTALIVVGWGITAYIFMSSYAILANKPLPYIDSVGFMHSTTILDNLVSTRSYFNSSPGTDVLQKNALFQEMRIPRTNVRLNLLPALKNDQAWVYRANSGHYFFLAPNDQAKADYLIVYVNSNWRSIIHPEDIIVGDNVFFKDNNDNSALFRITGKKVLEYGQQYVPTKADKMNLVLIVEKTSDQVEYVFQGENIANTSATSL